MNLIQIAGILGVATNYGIGLLLLIKGRNRLSVLLARVTLCLGTWCLAIVFFSIIPEVQYSYAFKWMQMGYCCVILIPVFYAHFVFEYTGFVNKYIIFLIYFVGMIFVALNILFPSLFLGNIRFVFNEFYWHDWIANKNIAYTTFVVLMYGLLLGFSFFLLIKRYVDSSGIVRNQLKYFILGSIVGWIGAELHYIGDLRLDLYSNTYAKASLFVGILLTGIYPFIIAFAILKYRLMDISIAITRASIFIILYTAVLGLPFYVGYSTNSWILSTSFAVVLASLGPLAYRALQEKAENILLAEQRRYQKILLQAANGMAKEHQLDRLLKLIVYIVKRTVKISFAASFVNDKENKLYRLKAFRGDKENVRQEIEFPYDHCFIKFLKGKDGPFLIEEMPQDIRNSLNLPFSPSLIVPSSFENNPLGFLLLGEKQNRKLYTTDDINVFKILAQQSALAVENCIFLEQFKKAQEQLFQAEKLASIGGMADGLAHQIKNRLNLFSVGAGEIKNEVEYFVADHPGLFEKIPDLKGSFDYVIDSANTMVSNVKKTNAIIQGILNFAKIEEKDTAFGEFSLQEVIDSSKDLLTVKHGTADLPITLVADNGDALFGVKAQIMESVFNILDNAFEAIKEKREYFLPPEERNSYVPYIRVTMVNKDTSSLVTIVDNGVGIKDENKRRIFAPFFTTKSSAVSGSGIGMYVVKRMVEENHKGRISFDSTYGEGTRFIIELPNRLT